MRKAFEKIVERLEEQRGHICNCMPCNGCKYIGDCNEGEFAEDANKKLMQNLIEAKKNCGEDSDCSECIFGQKEDVCYLQELQISGGNYGWIPCSSGRLPEEGEIYEVTATFSNGTTYTEFAYYDYDKEEWWKYDDSGILNVLAWRNHLEPYQPKEE